MSGVSKYWKEGENGEKGEPEEIKGNNQGIYTVPTGQIVTAIPKGTLITLTIAPAKLPGTPLVDRKWVQFVNEDLVDIQLCDDAGVVFLKLEPGQKSEKYCAASTIDFYGKVASGTADTGIRVIEGK